MKIALIGYGKMGQAIEEIAIQRNHEIVLRITIDNLEEFTTSALQKADTAIEFTGPDSAFDNIKKCMNAGVPVISGSTGWTERLDEIQKICGELHGAFLYASNFSIGVNIFFEINKKLASMMAQHKDYNVSIEETHHTQKLDAPSGTAITIAEQIMTSIKRKKNWVNNTSNNPEELEIISKRIDPAAGIHRVKYSSAIDDIEIVHTAHNRKGFALGAVMAAEFIKDKKGIFEMKDVLKF